MATGAARAAHALLRQHGISAPSGIDRDHIWQRARRELADPGVKPEGHGMAHKVPAAVGQRGPVRWEVVCESADDLCDRGRTPCDKAMFRNCSVKRAPCAARTQGECNTQVSALQTPARARASTGKLGRIALAGISRSLGTPVASGYAGNRGVMADCGIGFAAVALKLLASPKTSVYTS